MQLSPGCDIDGLRKAIHRHRGDAKFKLFFWEVDLFDRFPGTMKLSDFLDSNVNLRMEYKSAGWLSDLFIPPGKVTIHSDQQRKIIVPVRGKTARICFEEKHINTVEGCSYNLTTTKVGLRLFLQKIAK